MRVWREAAAVLVAGVSIVAAVPARAADSQQTLVDKATLTVQDMFSGAKPDSGIMKNIRDARAVLICPSIFEMSIVFGGSGGGCLLLARDAQGSWSDPAFYRLSSGSFGLQLGMQDSQVMFFIMTDRGLQALLDSQMKLGANASASFATMGSGVGSGNAGRSNTDITGIQKSKGLFAGASLSGSKLSVNSSANRSYYNQAVGPEDIVITMRVNNPAADSLRSILMKVGGKSAAASAAGGSSAAASGSEDAAPDYVPSSSSSGSVQSSSLPPLTSSSKKASSKSY
ncbi:lipid-binding SYLF domain-containing protein [Acetobacter sp. AN02]|uniref:lipid-binding SYLF domain-containing protein n=1 Tax=Acetobacter sp. AN02 TaxID=2894186 RepID=UPI0038D105B0